jgi:NAD dependent epimerase/dehydratase family enzyme
MNLLLTGASGRIEETLLASTRGRPARLPASGFRFGHPDLSAALPTGLGRAA